MKKRGLTKTISILMLISIVCFCGFIISSIFSIRSCSKNEFEKVLRLEVSKLPPINTTKQFSSMNESEKEEFKMELVKPFVSNFIQTTANSCAPIAPDPLIEINNIKLSALDNDQLLAEYEYTLVGLKWITNIEYFNDGNGIKDNFLVFSTVKYKKGYITFNFQDNSYKRNSFGVAY